MKLPRSPSCLLALGAVCSLAAAPLAAQDASSSDIVWDVGPTGAGWCVHFLMEPKDAVEDMPKGHQPVLARYATGLPGAMQRLIGSEPEYADWVPATLCTYTVESLTANRRRFDKGDGGQPLAFLYWGIAASSEGTSSDSAGMTYRIFATNSSGLQRVMEVNAFPMQRVPILVKPLPGGEDQQYQLRLEGATIFFDGHPRQDSTLSVAPVRQSGSYRASTVSVWRIDVNVDPAQIAAMSGALRIQGKRGLAETLNRSPIRLLGPIVSGGSGQVLFNH